MLSETSVNLQVEGVEVVAKFGSAALVGEGVVSLEDEVFAEVVVGRKSPVGLQAVPGLRIAIAVPAAVEFEVFEERCAHHGVPSVRFLRCVDVGHDAALRRHIFAAHGPFVFILEAHSPAVAACSG